VGAIYLLPRRTLGVTKPYAGATTGLARAGLSGSAVRVGRAGNAKGRSLVSDRPFDRVPLAATCRDDASLPQWQLPVPLSVKVPDVGMNCQE